MYAFLIYRNLNLMKNMMKSFVVACAFVLSVAASPAVAGDVEAGAKVFKKCKACHVVDAEKNKTGPHLVNIMGRKAIQAADIVWDEATLDAYLTKPKAYIKGTRMAFAGLRKEADRANVIAYLKSFSE